MTTVHFDKASQRRDHEYEQAMIERDIRRFGYVRRILPPPAFPALGRSHIPKPSKGGFVTPWTWSPEEKQRLEAWRKDAPCLSTVRGMRSFGSPVQRINSH